MRLPPPRSSCGSTPPDRVRDLPGPLAPDRGRDRSALRAFAPNERRRSHRDRAEDPSPSELFIDTAAVLRALGRSASGE